MNFQTRHPSTATQTLVPLAHRLRIPRVNCSALAFACALTLALSSLQAKAAYPVIDLSARMQHQLNFLKTLAEYIAQPVRWEASLQHYQQQLIKLQRLQMLRPQVADDFPERAAEYGMDDLCPDPKRSTGGAILNKVMSQFNPQLDAEVIGEQRRLCQRMVLAENAKYNESVRMLKTLIKRNQEFVSLEAQRDQVGDSEGRLAANENEAQRFMIRTRMDLDYWQARMKAYDDYVVGLKQDQARLARRALEGKHEGGIVKILQTEALKAAFKL